MAIAIRVEAAVAGRRRAGVAEQDVSVELAPGASLRDLVASVVATELQAYDRRREERTFISVLTAGALTEAVGRGSVRSGGTDEIAAAPALGDAVATALLAFEDGIFQVYIDDEAIESLDEQVNLHEGSRLLFLRLVALAGG